MPVAERAAYRAKPAACRREISGRDAASYVGAVSGVKFLRHESRCGDQFLQAPDHAGRLSFFWLRAPPRYPWCPLSPVIVKQWRPQAAGSERAGGASQHLAPYDFRRPSVYVD